MLELGTLDDVRAYIEEISVRLDPHSRYIRELLEHVDAATDVGDLERRLLEGSRGARHSGPGVFREMTLAERVYANLITPETSLFRFSEGEMEAISKELTPALADHHARVLIVPCSHGEEAYTIAAHFLKLGVDFEVDAFDIQPALIEEAKTGRLTFGYPEEYLEAPGRVSREVLDRIRFRVGDAFSLPESRERYDVVLCRNFIGYFIEPDATSLVRSLADRVSDGGVLIVDGFCLSKLPGLERALTERGGRRLGRRPVFLFEAS